MDYLMDEDGNLEMSATLAKYGLSKELKPQSSISDHQDSFVSMCKIVGQLDKAFKLCEEIRKPCGGKEALTALRDEAVKGTPDCFKGIASPWTQL
jgi:hypothetical protein